MGKVNFTRKVEDNTRKLSLETAGFQDVL